MLLDKEEEKNKHTYTYTNVNRENMKTKESYFFNRRRRLRYFPNKIFPNACRKSGENIV